MPGYCAYFPFHEWKEAFIHFYVANTKQPMQLVISQQAYTSGYWIEEVDNLQEEKHHYYRTDIQVRELALRIKEEIEKATRERRSPKFIV